MDPEPGVERPDAILRTGEGGDRDGRDSAAPCVSQARTRRRSSYPSTRGMPMSLTRRSGRSPSIARSASSAVVAMTTCAWHSTSTRCIISHASS
jgi:hypothetical protein